jgi:LL-diaminopimelate aminotransferase
MKKEIENNKVLHSSFGGVGGIADRLSGIEEYYFSTKLRQIDEMNKVGKNVINLGIGSPDLPPHPDVIKTLAEEAVKPNQHGYQSYKGSPVLRNAISKWYKKWYDVDLNPDTEILPLIGSKEGIMHICMTYINPGDVVLIPNPGYPTYKSAATIAGANVIAYTLKKENNWCPDFNELEKLDLQNVKLMFVNYPQMPTGQLPTHEIFKELISFAKKYQILICHDNPYSFILNDHPMSLLSIEGAKEVVIELNSFSKSHNMAGWRVGMLCGAKERIAEVLRFKSNMDSGMFLPLQLAAAKALELDQDWHDAVNAVYKKRREKVVELLDLLNCFYDKNQAGLFVWAAIPSNFKNGFELSDEVLQAANVFITPGGIFGNAGDKYVRVSLCTTEEKLDEAINRIQKLKN